MLHVTPEAGLAIRKLAAAEGAPTTGGLRIEASADDPNLTLSTAVHPTETDVVVTEETTGARVILDPLTAEHLADKALDVTDTVESTARFELASQGTSTAD